MASLTTAPSSLELEISVPKMLTSKEELEMMRNAYALRSKDIFMPDRQPEETHERAGFCLAH